MKRASATLVLLALAGCGGTQAPDGSPRLVLGPCLPEEGIEDGLCGTLEVYENREASSGRTISLRIAVLPALSGNPRPDPLFFLAGGPGQAASELTDIARVPLREINRERDLVFVDQRGTGKSNPLTCDLEDEDRSAEDLMLDPMADSILRARTHEILRRCVDELNADPRFYTTPIAMDDLDEVREALGYPSINLWGGSYGTRAALVYLRRHPDRVRTVILDGVAPVSIKLPVHMGHDGNRALQLVVSDCAAAPECNAAYPDLKRELDELLARLDETPVRYTLDHPRTGAATEVPITRTSVASMIRGTLYSADLAAVLPLAIHKAHAGDYRPLAAMAIGIEASVDITVGMFLSVICAEDVPAITDADRKSAAGDPFFGSRLVDAYAHMCEVWPRGMLPRGYHEPVRSDRPVLLLSGLLDPVTPPRWADEAGRYLTNSLHITVPGVAHGTLGAGCVPDLMETFIQSASIDELDSSCVDDIERPRFFDSPLGPGTRDSATVRGGPTGTRGTP